MRSSNHAVSKSESRVMRPRIHAAARRRDRRQMLLGACCSSVSYLNFAHFCRLSGTEPLWTIEALCRRADKQFGKRGICKAENRPKRAKEGRSRGAKCASAAHEGGVPLGFQPRINPRINAPQLARRGRHARHGQQPAAPSPYWRARLPASHSATGGYRPARFEFYFYSTRSY